MCTSIAAELRQLYASLPDAAVAVACLPADRAAANAARCAANDDAAADPCICSRCICNERTYCAVKSNTTTTAARWHAKCRLFAALSTKWNKPVGCRCVRVCSELVTYACVGPTHAFRTYTYVHVHDAFSVLFTRKVSASSRLFG